MKEVVRRGILALAIIAASPGSSAAETVIVKYRGPVDLAPFECHDITRSSFVNRVCHDEASAYMVCHRTMFPLTFGSHLQLRRVTRTHKKNVILLPSA